MSASLLVIVRRPIFMASLLGKASWTILESTPQPDRRNNRQGGYIRSNNKRMDHLVGTSGNSQQREKLKSEKNDFQNLEICVGEPGGRTFKKVFINFLSSSFVVALVPGGLPLLPFLSLKVSAACEMAEMVGFLPFCFRTIFWMVDRPVGFSPRGGWRRAKHIALVS